MDKNLAQGIMILAGVLLLHAEGREVIDLWLGSADRHVVTIGQATKPDAGMPEHAGDREAEGQSVRMARATQIATPYAGVFYGSPEGPAR